MRSLRVTAGMPIALRMMFTRMDYHQFRPRWLSWLVNTVTVGKYYPEEKHPVSRVLFRVYEPACRWVLEHSKITLGVVLALLISTIPVYFKLGHEFMPPLNEGAYLYMPTALPGMSVTANIETRYRTNVLSVPILSVTTPVPTNNLADAGTNCG